jgi:hypothetical protein
MNRRLVVLIVLALVVAGCGSGEVIEATTLPEPVTTTTQATTTTAPTTTTTTTTTPADASGASPQLASIRAALASSSEITSARMEGLIVITGGLDGSMTMDVSLPFGGAFDAATGNSLFYMDLSAMAGAMGDEEIPAEFGDLLGEMEVRVVDGVSYIKFPFFALLLGAQTTWISAPADESSDLTRDFTFGAPNDPTSVLADLEGAHAEVTEIGRETVNGVQTTHYLVVFDTARLYAEASATEREALQEHGYIPDGLLPTDLWISDDGFIVRYVMDIDGAVTDTGAAEGFERMVMTFDLLDINQSVTIVAPDASDVTDVESLGAGFFGFPEG